MTQKRHLEWSGNPHNKPYILFEYQFSATKKAFEVYVIFHDYMAPKVDFIGKDIFFEIRKHKLNPPPIEDPTKLLFTSAEVNKDEADGIIKYLCKVYNFPCNIEENIEPIPVNLPFHES